MQHIQKYLVPGLDLIALNPKHSIAILGKEALESEATMSEVGSWVGAERGQS